MREYIIVGDTEKFKDCLVYVCGASLEHANDVLNKMLTNPDDNDKKVMKGLCNFKVKAVPEEDCWWHGNLD